MVTKTNQFESPPQHKNSNLNKIKCKHKKITTYQDNKNDGSNMPQIELNVSIKKLLPIKITK